mmetsp:Transcript_125879/g.317356  ORF Transcript_125879/g.317356 Transcript_125879/m.317356 type:complete len:337 (+) Transcript_125879:80-1090(+)
MAFPELLGQTLVSKSGLVDTSTALADKKAVGLYFSAHWCPPCRGFTPKLAKSYAEHLQGKGLEIVFVSSDDDAKSFEEYYGSMPWLAIPFQDAGKKKLKDKFEVEGIPCLVLLDNDGSVLNSNAKSMLELDPKGEKFAAWATDCKGGVPRGMTGELAEQKTTWAKVLLNRHLLGKMAFLQLATPLAELILGVLFALRNACSMSLLVWWLLFDGVWGLVYYSLEYFTEKRAMNRIVNTDLQAYLIRKERDGTTDSNWEAEAALMTPPSYMKIFSTGDIISSVVGSYLYASTAYGSCNDDPLKAVFYLIILKILVFFIQSVVVIAAVAEAQGASSDQA